MKYFKSSSHSSKYEITGSLSKQLEGKKIVIGLTGSVAVAESVNLSRLLMRHGAEVFVVMTKAAIDLIHPNLLHWATGNPVITELTGEIEHVHLCGEHPDKVDLLLIAPSTANTIGKIAAGIDDTVVTTFATTAIGTGMPVAIVPAMHATMYDNPMVLENINKLKKNSINFIGPRIEEGKAKIATNEEILEKTIALLTKKDLKKKIVVTAGPTRVWIDDIRFISNPSSGKMGIEIAKEAASRGAEVTLILGPSNEQIHNPEIKVIKIETPEEMIEEINKIKQIDIFISAAAISDYQTKKQKGKIKSKQKTLTLELFPTPKVIDFVKEKYPKAVIVGFKAESGVTEEELIKQSEKSLKEHKIAMVIGNIVNKPEQGFATTTNRVFIIQKNKKTLKIPLSSKRLIAKRILNQLVSINIK